VQTDGGRKALVKASNLQRRQMCWEYQSRLMCIGLELAFFEISVVGGHVNGFLPAQHAPSLSKPAVFALTHGEALDFDLVKR
jgi:hypothetical protein